MKIHASIVKAPVKLKGALVSFGTTTWSSTPSRSNAWPTSPVPNVAPPTSVPCWPPMMSKVFPSAVHQCWRSDGAVTHCPAAVVIIPTIKNDIVGTRIRNFVLNMRYVLLCLKRKGKQAAAVCKELGFSAFCSDADALSTKISTHEGRYREHACDLANMFHERSLRKRFSVIN